MFIQNVVLLQSISGSFYLPDHDNIVSHNYTDLNQDLEIC